MQPMGLFRKLRGPAAKKGQKFSDEVFFCFRRRCQPRVPSVSVEHAYLRENVRALVFLTFLKQGRRRPQRNVGKNELEFFQT